MAQFKTVMDVLRLLDKSNCQKCGQKTCLAFAATVHMGRKPISDCPKIRPEAFPEEALNEPLFKQTGIRDGEDFLGSLKAEITRADLSLAAKRIGADFPAGRLTLKVLGKDVGVDAKGDIFTDIHVNPWMVAPFLSHVLYGRGIKPTGRWISFRDFPEGAPRYPLFKKRGEDVMKRIADAHTDLFDDMVHLFGGRPVEPMFESDVSVVLYPLPLIPFMVCYRGPEDGLPSTLNLFFDETADKNLDIGALFTLGTGLSQMFSKITARHGVPKGLRDAGNHGV